MATSAKNKIFTCLVIALLTANITALLIFWLGVDKMHRVHPYEQPAEFLIRQLSLNDNQQQRYKELVKQHHEQTSLLLQQERSTKDSFFDLLSRENISDSLKNNFAAKNASLNQQLDVITFDHFKAVRKMCTPAQQQKFDAVIKNVLSMMRTPSPGENRPAPGPAPMDDRPPPPGN